MLENKYNSIHIPTVKFHAFANLPPSLTGLARKPPCCPLLVSWKVIHVVGPTIESRETLQGGACWSTRESSYGVWRVLINIKTSIAGFPSNLRNWTTAQGRKNTNPSLVYFVVTFKQGNLFNKQRMWCLMAESSGAADADEPPSMLWGLDPVFSACSRLYIIDILEMRESRQVPGRLKTTALCFFTIWTDILYSYK